MTEEQQIARAKQVFDIEIDGLRRTRDSLGESFTRAISLMRGCMEDGGVVVVSGVGKNLHVAEKISAILSSTGTKSIVLNPVQAMHGDLGMTGPKDILIALSFSGESEEVVRLIPAVRRHGLKVVSMVGNPESTLAKLSDVVVQIPCGKEACPFGMAPTNSTTATMAMGDALAMVMLDEQKFSIEEYAGNHPAGAIGRALVMKVTDVMRTGDRLAVVSPESTVMDALLAMTRAKAGSAAIADADGNVSEGRNILGDPVGGVMTASPLFVRNDIYAADLLKVFEKRRIDDLPVCDAEGKLVGMVDIQDLPKMKVI